ncbi:MAG: peptidoglycan-binding protein [Clostridia bacterium]|nr:peptidoglycan-binding protein [Clostridia bacterium]
MQRGDDVRALQEQLTSLGFACGPIDGIFGDKTKAAVKAFQAAAGVVVDGIVGPITRGALAAALDSTASK